MELWIRVQKNKKLKQGLVKVEDLMVDKDVEGKWCIYQSCDTLAIYKNEKRALEVLDEIQNILHPTVFMSAEIDTNDNNWVENGIIYQKYKDNFDIQQLSIYVYQMPEE